MAKMIPSNEEEFSNSYGERQVFRALRDGLPDDYTVLHSFRWNKKTGNNRIEWGEADFTVFHPRYGLLVIEVKSGGIILDNGHWFYERTDNNDRYPMKDPLEQANRTKYNLKDLIDGVLPMTEYCWIESAVWFPSLSDRSVVPNMPNTYHPEIVLMEWALSNTKQAIENAYRFYCSEQRTSLLPQSAKQIVKTLAPAFHAIPNFGSMLAEQEYLFLRLTNEQSSLLDYLDEQPSATIQGSAGTGKTMLAVEKAKRLAKDGNVLFLCFNRFLVDDLREKHQEYKDSISFYNLPSLVKMMKATTSANNDEIPADDDISDYLCQYGAESNWPYRHIIIDEGQDFHEEHLELLAVIAKYQERSFYIFFDKNQLVQRKKIPEYLQKSECRLILRRNCRNTQNIAMTSASAVDMEPIFWERLPAGKKPSFYVLPDVNSLLLKLMELITTYIADGISTRQITILTIKKEETSLLNGVDKVGKHKLVRTRKEEGILFTTARKFKGLESDIVIIIDVDSGTFASTESKNLFYVGTSRAKHLLDIVAVVDEKELNNIAKTLTGEETKSGNSKIASFLKVRICDKN